MDENHKFKIELMQLASVTNDYNLIFFLFLVQKQSKKYFRVIFALMLIFINKPVQKIKNNLPISLSCPFGPERVKYNYNYL